MSVAAQLCEKCHVTRLAVKERRWFNFRVIRNAAIRYAIYYFQSVVCDKQHLYLAPFPTYYPIYSLCDREGTKTVTARPRPILRPMARFTKKSQDKLRI